MGAALLQHPGEARPLVLALVLSAEFALAVAPAAVRDHCGDAFVDTAGIDRDRAAEARSHQRNAIRIDRRMLRQEGERVSGVLDLLETDHAPELALAVAAAAHAETQRDVAE